MRPKIHLTAPAGWINDPNGLVFYEGKYHFYYQHNPTDTKWGNIHWGHAESSDMLSFTHTGDVLLPDHNGMMYSGSAIVDTQDRAGFGAGTILYFYTAMGKQGVQCLAHSSNGRTITKDGIIVPTIAGENRDPKVFYHPETDAFVMVLFLEKFEFAILRSKDCKSWELTQKLSFDGMRECPDLFRIRENWVFWSAQGYYIIGEFDGFTFTPRTDRLSAYAKESVPYASQTFSGLERTVSVGWFNSGFGDEPWFGMLTLPHELDIVDTPDGPRIAHRNIPALSGYNRNLENNALSVSDGSPFMFEAELHQSASSVEIDISGTKITVPVKFHKDHKLNVTVDSGIIEILAKDGTYYSVLPFRNDTPEIAVSLKIQ